MHKNKVNFIDEEFLDTSVELHKRLLSAAIEVDLNIKTRSVQVSQLTVAGKEMFRNTLRQKGFEPNSFNNPYAKSDYQGLYVFSEKRGNKLVPLYFGISRSIMRRVLGHCNTATKYYGTWAYMMAKLEYTEKTGKKNIPERLQPKLISQKQAYIKQLYFTLLLIDETEPAQHAFMHILETFCASYFKAYWNSFKTH